MADAGERKPKLGDMTSGHLPATRKGAQPPANREDRQEPQVPTEQQARSDRGRSPEDVLADQEQSQVRQQPQRTSDTEEKQTAPAKKVKVKGQELTLEDLAKRPDLLDALAITSEKYTELQHKHTRVLEQLADRALQPPEQKPAQPVELTPEQRWQQYQQGILAGLEKYKAFAEQVTDFLVKAGKIESDAPEAYKELITTIVADSVAKNDRIDWLEGQINAMREWIRAEIDGRKVRTVQSILDNAIDAVAAKGDDEKNKDATFYQVLRNPEHRAGFEKWIREELDPKVGMVNAENVERWLKAYIVTSATDLLKLSQKTEVRETPTTNRRESRGETRGSRVGGPPEPEGEKTHLSRMIDLARPGLFKRD